MAKDKKKWLFWSVLVVVAVALFLFYAFAYQYHFYYQEQNQIFLYAPDWINSYFEKPGWLVRLAGDWLTQFYFYQYAGPAILAVIIASTAALAFLAVQGLYKSHSRASIVVPLAVGLSVLAWLFFGSMAAECRLSSILTVSGWVTVAWLLSRVKWWGLLALPLAFWLFGLGSWPMPGKPQWEYEQRLAIENEYYFGNYDKAIALARKYPQPNAVTSFYYYLSQAQKGMLADSLLCYPVRDLGTLAKIGDQSPLPVINMMNELYYVLGDMTYAERAAMMRNVFSPDNRNVRMIKRLAEVNLASEDTLAAMKYLRMLSKTHVYRSWAAKRIPGSMHPEVENHLKHKRKMVNKQDTLRLGDNCYTILVELLESNPDNTVALDYLLCTDLLVKDMESFKKDYDHFCMERGKPRDKSLYQQALMIYLAGTGAPKEEWERYITSPGLLQRFSDYNNHRGDSRFSDTYWYYFDTKK